MTSGESVRRRRVVTGFVVGAVLFGTSCYTYVPVDAVSRVRAGDEVEVTLSDAGTARLTPALGPRVRSLAGQVTAGSDTGAAIAVTGLTRLGASPENWGGDTVRVTPADVQQFTRRQLARGPTVVVAALAAVGAVLGARALGQASGGGHNGGNSGRQ